MPLNCWPSYRGRLMDELYDLFKQYAVTTLAVFSALALWSWQAERARRRQYRQGLERAMQRAGERMEQGGRGVEFIPVEDWPDSLEVKDK